MVFVNSVVMHYSLPLFKLLTHEVSLVERWKDIIELARHTPSPHNVQPWKFKIISDSKAELYIDKSRMLPKEDLTGNFVLSAMVMMTESLQMIAANRNYKLDVRHLYEGDNFDLNLFAELTLTKDESIKSDYDDALFTVRRTSRLHYDKTEVPSNALDRLAELAKEYGFGFDCTTSSKQINRLLDFNIRALFCDLNKEDYHDEIEEYFRYTDKQSQNYRDGLDYRCMNVPKHEFWISGKLPVILKIPLIKNILHLIYKKRLGPIVNIAWLTGDFFGEGDHIQSGKCLMRFWLECAKLGLYFHPFGNLVTNPEAAKLVKNELQQDDIWLIFKLGFSKEPPKSKRLYLEEVLVE